MTNHYIVIRRRKAECRMITIDVMHVRTSIPWPQTAHVLYYPFIYWKRNSAANGPRSSQDTPKHKSNNSGFRLPTCSRVWNPYQARPRFQDPIIIRVGAFIKPGHLSGWAIYQTDWGPPLPLLDGLRSQNSDPDSRVPCQTWTQAWVLKPLLGPKLHPCDFRLSALNKENLKGKDDNRMIIGGKVGTLDSNSMSFDLPWENISDIYALKF